MSVKPADELRRTLLDGLPPMARLAVEAIVASADAYAVGGCVRDLMLGRPPLDLDIVTVSDAIDIATRAWPGIVVTTHEAFRTASATFEGVRIDLATARSESYARPGSLPDVRPGASIEEDLRRRDFTVNAISLRLDRDATLLDPYGGVGDIDAKLIRVLHDRSFEDDPTRIYRAFRYAARLGFSIDAQTTRLIKPALRYVADVSGERLRRELELMLSEAQSVESMSAADVVGALTAIHPVLRWPPDAGARMISLLPDDADVVAGGFALLAASASPEDADALVERLRLTREEAAEVRAMPSLAQVAPALRRAEAKPSGVVVLLDRYPLAAVLAFGAAAGDEQVRQIVERYVREWRHEKPILRGSDLQDMGVPAGPQIARGLQLIRAARLDGWAHDRDDERALVLRFAKSIRDSGFMRGEVRLDPDDFRRN